MTLQVPLDSFFQHDPFESIEDRGGIVLAFGPPSNVSSEYFFAHLHQASNRKAYSCWWLE
jgi:hypothetical protein